VHKEFGGVVPNLAKREHQRNLPIVLKKVLHDAGFEYESRIMNYELGKREKSEKIRIDLIAVTIGPGLEPALWTGIEFAKKIGEEWGIPVIGVNHMEGHIASVLLTQNHESRIMNYESKISFPAAALLISGGHTELVLLNSWIEVKKIGETLDDAVGEAFDKVARMLGLPYPGGPEISKLAEKARDEGVKLESKFPRPMINSKDLNFSFSGLKTAVLYYLRNLRNGSTNETDFSSLHKMAVAREFEDAVIETLLHKTKSTIEAYNPKTLIIGGGVVANKALRERFTGLREEFPNLQILIPQKSLTGDNATMMAAAGYIEHLKGRRPDVALSAKGNLDIEEV
jgi:N6-L-threonylcarbamoyladenine synthase